MMETISKDKRKARKEALKNRIIIKDEKGNYKYNGRCKECKYSECYSYPAAANMCMNKNCLSESKNKEFKQRIKKFNKTLKLLYHI